MKILAVLALITILPVVFAASCEDAYDQMEITKDKLFCSKSYDVPNGIRIATNSIILDCNGAIVRGAGLADGQGIIIDHANGVTIKNCNIVNYNTGIYIKEGNHNAIFANNLLKNNIGIRLLQSFENRFENNADKSLVKPVSAIASKFNSFFLTNRNIDKDFCAVNLCNQQGTMNPCENGDFYCSQNCTPDNDTDCMASTEETTELQQTNTQLQQKILLQTPATQTTQAFYQEPALPSKTNSLYLVVGGILVGLLIFLGSFYWLPRGK